MDTEVIVAGGGPVGLLLACELRLAGVDVLVLERRREPDLTIKAGSVNAPTMEAFHRRGLLPALTRAQRENLERMRQFLRQQPADAPTAVPPRPLGHFAGMMLSADLLDPDDPEFAGLGPVEAVGLIPQRDIERILAERAAELGVRLLTGTEVTGLAADDEGVTVQAGDSSFRAPWLVGCDGGRSAVRKLSGFAFPGTEGGITGHQAVVELSRTDGLRAGWNLTDTGVYVHGPLPGRILTVEFDGPPVDREGPVTAEELQGSLRRVSGLPVVVDRVASGTRFTDNARQASTYRLGRVLLAGDAAHVHAPFGAQGLNLGIGDAMNLGWKLAAVVRDPKAERLLDTYTAERHPIGARVLDWTRAQVLLMRPEPASRALRTVVGDLMNTGTGTGYFVRMISGVQQRYELPGDHPLVGRSAPDLLLADGSRLADHLHDGRGLLLDLLDDPELRAGAEGYRERVRTVTLSSAERPGTAALLVRPDGCVAWAADSGAPSADVPLEAALATWFG